MKKFLLLALLAAGTEAAQAQSIPAGTISLGGSVGYSRFNYKSNTSYNNTNYSTETNSSQFSFTPSVGYFLQDNLAVGLSLGYSANRRNYTTYSPSSNSVRAELDPTTTLRVGPYVQYYKMISEQFGVLGTLSGGYQNSHNYEYNGNNANASIVEYKGSGYYADLTPGIIFFPIPKFGISASIGSLSFNRFNYDYPNTPGNTAPSGYEAHSSSLGAGFGFDRLLFGGTYYIGR